MRCQTRATLDAETEQRRSPQASANIRVGRRSENESLTRMLREKEREREGEWSEADERRASRDTFVAALIEKPLSLFHRDNGSRNVL